ncbi:MAG: alpha/beta hydrolase-fold protein [Pirellulales bacterium]
MPRIIFVVTLITRAAGELVAQEPGHPPPVISAAQKNEHGFLVHRVECEFQAGTTKIHVLLPDEIAPGQRLPVVYVLPVEAGEEHRFGRGLPEIARLDLHNQRKAIFVAPTFSHLPWYADHPATPTIRQESYLVEVVIPFVEMNYPAEASLQGRLLLGFSKSGWGAWSLLLRHSKLFGKAAAWDAPLMMEKMGGYGNTPIMGDEQNFQRYRVSTLLAAQADALAGEPRLILTGYDNFRQHHRQAHALLDKLKIPHKYRDGPRCPHVWHGGWITEAVELLLEKSETDKVEE